MSYSLSDFVNDCQSFQTQVDNAMNAFYFDLNNTISNYVIMSDNEIAVSMANCLQAEFNAMADAANAVDPSAMDPASLILWQDFANSCTQALSSIPVEPTLQNIGDWLNGLESDLVNVAGDILRSGTGAIGGGISQTEIDAYNKFLGEKTDSLGRGSAWLNGVGGVNPIKPWSSPNSGNFLSKLVNGNA